MLKLFASPDVEYVVFKKGDYIGHQGAPLKYVHYLLEGSSKNIFLSENGQELVVNTKSATDTDRIINAFGIFLKPEPYTQCDTIALEDCRCIQIPIKTFQDYLKTDNELMMSLLEIITTRHSELLYQVGFRQEGNTASSVCEYLLKFADKNESYLPKDLSKTSSIAQKLGIHAVTVSKVLGVLKKEGIIEKSSNTILIKNSKELRNYATKKKKMDYKNS